jgi:hypothetical protein
LQSAIPARRSYAGFLFVSAAQAQSGASLFVEHEIDLAGEGKGGVEKFYTESDSANAFSGTANRRWCSTH